MKALRGSLVAVAAAAAVMAGAAPAQAHSGHWIEVYGGGYLRGQARWDGDWLTVCDRRTDGLSVRAHYRTYQGGIYYSGWAPPAASGDCQREGHPNNQIYQFRVCVENYGCSSWHNRY